MSINQNARQLNWSQIEQFWFYDDLHFDGTRSPIKIPTLQEWLNEFQNDTRLKLIWLDVKAKDEDSIGAIAKSLSEILPKYLKAKIQFSTSGKSFMIVQAGLRLIRVLITFTFSGNGELIQHELSRLGLVGLASRVVVDTVPYSPYIGDVEKYNAINKALKMEYKSGMAVSLFRICLKMEFF